MEGDGGDSSWPAGAINALADSSRLSIALLDSDLAIRRSNPALQRLCGQDEHELHGRPLALALKIAGTGELDVLERQLDVRGVAILGSTALDGRHYLNMTLTRLRDGSILFHAEDATEELRLTNELQVRTSRDALTGLHNRDVFIEELQRNLNHDRGAGILLLDVDKFKLVNDSLGHVNGDKLLEVVGARLQNAAGNRNIVARFGGDEFAVVVRFGRSIEDVAEVGERVCEAFRDPFVVSNRRIHTGVSIGAAFGPTESHTAERILEEADVALYRAKAAGGMRLVTFNDEMRAEAEDRFELETDLRSAVADGEIGVALQGIYRLEDLSLEGYEALARWRHPERGVIAAADFVTLAEDLGLGRLLTETVLKGALLELGGDLQTTNDRRLAINLPPAELEVPSLVAHLGELLSASNIPPERLVIELTERQAIYSAGRTLSTLNALRNAGVGLAIDDFGAGASSLSHFSQLPITEIKVDKSLTARLGSDNVAESIFESVITLANKLGLGLVAEGVETEGQLSALRDLGCPSVQGYLIARPQLLDPSASAQGYSPVVDGRAERVATSAESPAT